MGQCGTKKKKSRYLSDNRNGSSCVDTEPDEEKSGSLGRVHLRMGGSLGGAHLRNVASLASNTSTTAVVDNEEFRTVFINKRLCESEIIDSSITVNSEPECSFEDTTNEQNELQNRAVVHTSEGDDGLQLIGGNIYFYPLTPIGHGSKAVVYKGRYGKFKNKNITVKAIGCIDKNEAEEIDKEIKGIYREIKTMETLIDPTRDSNIVDFIDSHINMNNTVYIAFELGRGTLVDYVNETNQSWKETLKCIDVNRGISEGVRFIHEKGIVHRDLKPANIFIVPRNDDTLKAVIGDFGSAQATTGSMFTLTGRMGSIGYIAPEIWKLMSQNPSEPFGSRCNKKSDIYSAALVFYFTLSLGKHLYGHEMTAQDGIQKGRTPTFDGLNKVRNAYAHQSLLECMLDAKPEDRSRAVEICSHPANWTDHQIIKYLAEKSDEIENLIKSDPSKTFILEDPNLIPNGNWMNNLPANTRSYLQNYRVNRCSSKFYDGKETNVRALLRAIRNTNSHFNEYPQNVQTELGDFPEGHVDIWLNVCPKLLMHVMKTLGPL